MKFPDYLILFRRRWKEIAVITLLTMLCTYGFLAWKNSKPYEATVFMSIGVKSFPGITPAQNDPFENVQAADQFSETVQGWFKNPGFEGRISKLAEEEVNTNAQKQEKQNVVITFSESFPEQAAKVSDVIKKVLNEEILNYNSQTGSNFQLALYSTNIEHKPLSVLLFLFLGLIAGIFLGSAILLFYEYSFQIASYDAQLIGLLKKNCLEMLPGQKLKKKQLSLLLSFVKKFPGKNVYLAGINLKPALLEHELQDNLPEKKIESMILPEDAGDLPKAEHLVLVGILGKTSLVDVKKLIPLLPQHFELVILEQ